VVEGRIPGVAQRGARIRAVAEEETGLGPVLAAGTNARAGASRQAAPPTWVSNSVASGWGRPMAQELPCNRR